MYLVFFREISDLLASSVPGHVPSSTEWQACPTRTPSREQIQGSLVVRNEANSSWRNSFTTSWWAGRFFNQACELFGVWVQVIQFPLRSVIVLLQSANHPVGDAFQPILESVWRKDIPGNGVWHLVPQVMNEFELFLLENPHLVITCHFMHVMTGENSVPPSRWFLHALIPAVQTYTSVEPCWVQKSCRWVNEC